MSPPPQLILEFDHRPALGGEDFLVASCNSDAVAWLDRWPGWPGPALVVSGPAGCGKSHLAQVFLAASGGVRLGEEQLNGEMPPDPWGESAACVIEDIDELLSGDDNERLEENLFHLYNTAREDGRHMLLTAATPPARWRFRLADLASRLKSSGVAEIGAPDDALIAAVLVKQFADRQMKIDGDAIAFVLARMERSFAAVGKLVDAADRLALAEGRRITRPLLARVLEDMEQNPEDDRD